MEEYYSATHKIACQAQIHFRSFDLSQRIFLNLLSVESSSTDTSRKTDYLSHSPWVSIVFLSMINQAANMFSSSSKTRSQ